MDNQARAIADPKKLLESWQNWWQLAGVEDIALDAPYNWCAPDEEPAKLAKATPSPNKPKGQARAIRNGQWPELPIGNPPLLRLQGLNSLRHIWPKIWRQIWPP